MAEKPSNIVVPEEKNAHKKESPTSLSFKVLNDFRNTQLEGTKELKEEISTVKARVNKLLSENPFTEVAIKMISETKNEVRENFQSFMDVSNLLLEREEEEVNIWETFIVTPESEKALKATVLSTDILKEYRKYPKFMELLEKPELLKIFAHPLYLARIQKFPELQQFLQYDGFFELLEDEKILQILLHPKTLGYLRDARRFDKLKVTKNIKVMEAKPEDAEDIETIYRHVAVNEGNVDNVLSVYDQRSFRLRGGMFAAMTKEQIETMIDDQENYIVYVARDGVEKDKNGQVISEGKVVGAYSCRRDASEYKDMTLMITRSHGLAKVVKNFLLALGLENHSFADEKQMQAYREKLCASPLVGGALDCLVHPSFQDNGIVKLLKYEMVNRLLQEGKLFMMHEIYRVISVKDLGTGEVDENACLPNVTSRELNKQFYAVEETGRLNTKTKTIGNKEVKIDPQVYTSYLTTAYRLLRFKKVQLEVLSVLHDLIHGEQTPHQA